MIISPLRNENEDEWVVATQERIATWNKENKEKKKREDEQRRESIGVYWYTNETYGSDIYNLKDYVYINDNDTEKIMSMYWNESIYCSCYQDYLHSNEKLTNTASNSPMMSYSITVQW
jgi:hypothetical protein